MPTTGLHKEWCVKFPCREDDRVLTFEKALYKTPRSAVILDDFGKLPHGYIDTFAAHWP